MSGPVPESASGYLHDCTLCGGWGQIYSQNKPYPDGPCLRCKGKGTLWFRGKGATSNSLGGRPQRLTP